MRNPALVFFDEMYGYTAQSERRANRELSEKELRKWWKHYSKRLPENVCVAAVYENEDGEIRDATEYWCMHECAKYAEAHHGVFN